METISPEWLTSIGMYTDGSNGEHSIRVVGADDDGRKSSSNDDRKGDEIARLVVVPKQEDGSAYVFLETYDTDTCNSTEIISLGKRHTRGDILLLCKALKAWGLNADVPAVS